MVLNLWDCGGQDAFYETYFAGQRDFIFRNVEVSYVNRSGYRTLVQVRKCTEMCPLLYLGDGDIFHFRYIYIL